MSSVNGFVLKSTIKTRVIAIALSLGFSQVVRITDTILFCNSLSSFFTIDNPNPVP
ncbi:MAG: hypothetical protein ACI9XP_000359 [Lentimonas sp.]|jgi:hypothetical protein